MIFFLLKICCFLTIQLQSGYAEFNYENPYLWSKTYPNCRGKRQSPININLSTAKKIYCKRHLQFYNYDDIPKNIKLTNTGQTLNLDFQWPRNHIPHIHETIFNNVYQLHSLHFHWNCNRTGSEHRIQGKRFPLEAHLVHFNIRYKTFVNALKHHDGLAVMGILFETKDNHKPTIVTNVVNNALKITEPGSSITVKPSLKKSFFNLKFLIRQCSYAFYLGSLTTPPCTENVTWLVVLQPLPISNAELKILRIIKLRHSDDHNNRPLQSINKRTVVVIKGIFVK